MDWKGFHQMYWMEQEQMCFQLSANQWRGQRMKTHPWNQSNKLVPHGMEESSFQMNLRLQNFWKKVSESKRNLNGKPYGLPTNPAT